MKPDGFGPNGALLVSLAAEADAAAKRQVPTSRPTAATPLGRVIVDDEQVDNRGQWAHVEPVKVDMTRIVSLSSKALATCSPGLPSWWIRWRCRMPDKSGPAASIMPLIAGYVPARLVFLAAELGIADLIANGTTSIESLAQHTGMHGPSLKRMLRALSAYDVFE